MGVSVSADFPLPVFAVIKMSNPWQRSREFSTCQTCGVWIPSHCVKMAHIHSLGWDDRVHSFFLNSVILWLYSASGNAQSSSAFWVELIEFQVFWQLPTHDCFNSFLWWEWFPSQYGYNIKKFQLVSYSDGSLPKHWPNWGILDTWIVLSSFSNPQ